MVSKSETMFNTLAGTLSRPTLNHQEKKPFDLISSYIQHRFYIPFSNRHFPCILAY